MIHTWHDTPIGPLLLVADDAHAGLREISFPRDGQKRDAPAGSRADAAPFAAARRQFDEYFAGTRRAFDLELAPEGTPFQQRVWMQLRAIPYGTTISYGELARRVGNPNASRAVGAANGKNPLSIVVPCHRVIGSTGRLTGFGGGIPTKRALLELEGALLPLGENAADA